MINTSANASGELLNTYIREREKRAGRPRKRRAPVTQESEEAKEQKRRLREMELEAPDAVQ